ncbi:MAG: type II toxin-antitoxin system Phd/YefM family antitoxin [Bacillota bacterium]|jgi:prevent-host-death family protein
MESLDLTTDIQPVTEFRANTSEILESLKKNRRTIILTQHGRPAAVLESVEEYQRKLEELRFMKGLVSGLKDIESNRVADGEDFFQNLKSKIIAGK